MQSVGEVTVNHQQTHQTQDTFAAQASATVMLLLSRIPLTSGTFFDEMIINQCDGF